MDWQTVPSLKHSGCVGLVGVAGCKCWSSQVYVKFTTHPRPVDVMYTLIQLVTYIWLNSAASDSSSLPILVALDISCTCTRLDQWGSWFHGFTAVDAKYWCYHLWDSAEIQIHQTWLLFSILWTSSFVSLTLRFLFLTDRSGTWCVPLLGQPLHLKVQLVVHS